MLKIKSSKIIVFGFLLLLIINIVGCKNNEEGLVAKVNGEGITEEEFQTDFQVLSTFYKQQYGEDAMTQVGEDGRTMEERIKDDTLEKLIVERLIALECKKNGIEITEEELKGPLQEYINLLGGQEQYEKFLETNKISKEYFEDNIGKELLYKKHRDNYIDNTAVSDKEAEEYFEANVENLTQVKAKHILLKTEEEGKVVLSRLEAGEDFSKLAQELSADKTSAAVGGDLGYFGKGHMIAEFEEAAFDLNVGETSGLVKTEVGYHIIYLEDKKDNYEDLKDDIIKIIKDDKYFELIKTLRENAKVKIF